mgnify:CR=1 FL=1
MVPKGSAPALVRTTKASTESPSVAANASRDVINKNGELLEGSRSDKKRYREESPIKKQRRGVNDCHEDNNPQASTRIPPRTPTVFLEVGVVMQETNLK